MKDDIGASEEIEYERNRRGKVQDVSRIPQLSAPGKRERWEKHERE